MTLQQTIDRLLGRKFVDIPWSYSALDAFETCPRNYYLTRVIKIHQETFSGSKSLGLQVHDAMQNYINTGAVLPPSLTVQDSARPGWTPSARPPSASSSMSTAVPTTTTPSSANSSSLAARARPGLTITR